MWSWSAVGASIGSLLSTITSFFIWIFSMAFWLFTPGAIIGVIYVGIKEFYSDAVTWLMALFPGIANLVPNMTTQFTGLTSAIQYFGSLFAFNVGIPLLISAFFARFVLRRIPFIG